MNSHGEHRLRLIVHQIPTATIPHVLANRSKRLSPFTISPSIGIAAVHDVADHRRGDDLPSASLPIIDYKLTQARKDEGVLACPTRKLTR